MTTCTVIVYKMVSMQNLHVFTPNPSLGTSFALKVSQNIPLSPFFNYVQNQINLSKLIKNKSA